MKKIDKTGYVGEDGEIYEIIWSYGGVVFLGKRVDFFRDVIQVFATTADRIQEARENEDLPDKSIQ